MKSLKLCLILISSFCILSNIFIVNALKSEPLGEFDTPPLIDGVFTKGEWKVSQIYIVNNTEINEKTSIETYVYFLNDNKFLYVMVDATGDPTDSTGLSDICLLVFQKNGDEVRIHIEGTAGTTVDNDFFAKIGYGASPNNPNNHKIYEFKIPLEYLNIKAGENLDFCSPMEGKHGSMPYDGNTLRDNIYPPGLLYDDLSTWDEVEISKKPVAVGGQLLPNILPPLSFASIILLILVFFSKRTDKLNFNYYKFHIP
ncbi:hypothetical protein GF319_11995 [Candidatus Bathyarchaeota archaeon]|nr:hypothetical protein [Candidatus Bathyarchaeota archaeon]